MPWNTVWPIGNISVRANRAIGNQNTTYIETTMGPSAVGTNAAATNDHFWNVDANLDGHHRFVKLAPFTVGGLPANPAFNDTYIRNVLYAKVKTAIESTAQQDVQPFSINATGIMQMLGIRAMGVFNSTGATPTQNQVVYSHNLALQIAGTPGIVRDGTGRYTVTFANALPSNNYLVLGMAIRADIAGDRELLFEMASSAVLTGVKSTTRFKFMTNSDGGTGHDPLQAWFIVFGG